MRLLMICPSRGRPDRVQDMLKSFYDTRSYDTEICIAISKDDPRFEEYQVDENIIVCDSRYTVDKINFIATKIHPGVEYYGIIDDDQIFRTKGWDTRFIEEIEAHGGWGLACGDDKFTKDWHKEKHPNGCVVSGNFVKLFGYMVYPLFRHTGVDHWQADLFGFAQCLYYCPDVVIEHMHANVGKAPMDDNYKWVYSKEVYDEGMSIWQNWKATQMYKDVLRLAAAADNQGGK